MHELEFQRILHQAIEEHSEVLVDDGDIFSYDIRPFDECGLLTDKNGLVVRIDNSEFQVSIVKSK